MASAHLPLGFDWLTKMLAVGGAFPADGAQRLAREHAISHVVDLRAEARDDETALRRHGIRLLHLPTPDARAVSPAALRLGVTWIADALARRGRVLVHCQHGIGRSPLLAMCVLVDAGMAPVEALQLAKRARAVVSPSPDQLRAFISFVEGRRQVAAPWTVPSFEALATIAYRPPREEPQIR